MVGRDLGYEPDGVVVAEIQLTGPEYRRGEQSAAYWRSLLDEIDAVRLGLGDVGPSADVAGFE